MWGMLVWMPKRILQRLTPLQQRYSRKCFYFSSDFYIFVMYRVYPLYLKVNS